LVTRSAAVLLLLLELAMAPASREAGRSLSELCSLSKLDGAAVRHAGEVAVAVPQKTRAQGRRQAPASPRVRQRSTKSIREAAAFDGLEHGHGVHAPGRRLEHG
jgi:hypothetical protein